tara:strand:+ start:510 stop:878 length:369 start_codon:yes stop_codon:yes gene_type:complete
MKFAHLDGEKVLGWYTKEVHGDNIPTPNVEVTDEVWQQALVDVSNAYVDGKFVYKDFSTNDEKADSIRIQRDQLLEKSDWTQSNDVVLTNDAEWKTYRQELRDITTQENFPTDVTFPTKPKE